MATRQTVCYVAVCDLCGADSDVDDTPPHLTTPQDVIDWATAYNDGWALTPDGLLVCDNTLDTAHQTAHAEAGKRISDRATCCSPPLLAQCGAH